MVAPTTLIAISAAVIVHGSHADFVLRYPQSLGIEKFLRSEVHLSYAISDTDSNTIVLYSEGNTLYSFIRGKSSSIPNPRHFELFPESWNHVCHIVQENNYTVVWQGEIFANQRLSAEGEILLNGTLILGQEQDSLSNSFAADQVLCGDIAQVNIWASPLSGPEIIAMAKCVKPGSGDVFNLDTVDMEVFGNIRQSTVQLTQLCRTPPKFQILPEHKTFDDSVLMCQLLGLALTVPANEKENVQLFSELLPSIDKCSPNVWKLWIGIADILDEGVWLDVTQKKQIEYENFKPPYPYGGTELNCGAMLEDGFWGDETCDEPKCFACNQKPAAFVNLRGLCFTAEHRARFRIDGRRDGRAIFRGYYDLIIFWRKESQSWVLENVLTNSTLARLEVEDEDEYPIGLTEWVTQDQLCGIPSGSKISLSLSACLPHHFMCSSGECIAMAHRCDLRNNCADGSDEDNCEVVKLNAGYRRHLPPTDPGRTSLTIVPTIFIDRFVDVDDISMSIAMQFRIMLQWKDSRITFRHLNTKKKTILTENEVQQLWIPKYQLADVEGGRTEVLNRVFMVSSASIPTWPDHNSISMDPIYPGDNNNLILDVEHLAKFTCNFELYLYPFDVQRCSFQLRLLAAYENYVQLSDGNRTVTYNRSRVLTMYNVYNIKIGSDGRGQSVNVKFELHRRQGMILLSTFLPSMLLLLVSWSTLFVKLEALNVRAVMALTTLLVLYTLATNTSRILPATSTIKLVDVWFLFIIVLLFFNIMLHIFVTEGKFTSFFRVRDSSVKLLRVENKAALPEMARTSHSIRFLRLYRIVIMPLLLLVFNLIFWIMCLVNSNTSDSDQRD